MILQYSGFTSDHFSITVSFYQYAKVVPDQPALRLPGNQLIYHGKRLAIASDRSWIAGGCTPQWEASGLPDIIWAEYLLDSVNGSSHWRMVPARMGSCTCFCAVEEGDAWKAIYFFGFERVLH